jgi:hypothetical protein
MSCALKSGRARKAQAPGAADGLFSSFTVAESQKYPLAAS